MADIPFCLLLMILIIIPLIILIAIPIQMLNSGPR